MSSVFAISCSHDAKGFAPPVIAVLASSEKLTPIAHFDMFLITVSVSFSRSQEWSLPANLKILGPIRNQHHISGPPQHEIGRILNLDNPQKETIQYASLCSESCSDSVVSFGGDCLETTFTHSPERSEPDFTSRKRQLMFSRDADSCDGMKRC
jgi:hypothetical protein